MFLVSQVFIQAMEQRTVEPVRLAYIDWPGGAVYCHTGVGDILFQNKVWKGLGIFSSIGNVECNSNVGAHSVTMQVSGIDPKTLNEVITRNVINREVELYYGVLNEHGELIDAAPYFQGRISATNIVRYDSDAINVQATSKTADWAKNRPERYTHDSFIAINPGDYFCQYVDVMSERDLYWGSDKESIPLIPRDQQS